MFAKRIRNSAATFAILASIACDVHAEAALPISIEELKQTYLHCERRALVERISTNDIILCSVVYEDLKRLAFDGDWVMLWTWSKRALSRGEDV